MKIAETKITSTGSATQPDRKPSQFVAGFLLTTAKGEVGSLSLPGPQKSSLKPVVES